MTTKDIEALKNSEAVIQARDKSMLAEAPKSYYQFERDFKSLKKDRAKLMKYILNIRENEIKVIFKSDLETDMLLAIYQAFIPESDEYFKENSSSLIEVASGLVNAKPFEMACEFLMDDEKDTIKKFVEKVASNSEDADSADSIKKLKNLYKKYC